MATIDAADAKLDLSNRNAAKRVDHMLDEAVADSFPASDPVALAMPRQRVEPSAWRTAANPRTHGSYLAGGLLAVIALLAMRR